MLRGVASQTARAIRYRTVSSKDFQQNCESDPAFWPISSGINGAPHKIMQNRRQAH